MLNRVDDAIGMLVGLAVGDALGAPLEFQDGREPENYVTEYVSGGVWETKKGEWTDDTAMAFAMGCAIRDKKGFDANAIMDNFLDWYRNGAFIPRGKCFYIGNTTSKALNKYESNKDTPYCGSSNPETSGNGALMRIAPIAIAAPDRETLVQWAVQQTLLTHGSRECVHYSRIFAEELYAGAPLQKYNSERHPRGISRNSVMSGGYVKETYQAAMWAFQNTENFEDCVIAAVNLGHDTDTTGAVAGMIAGAFYGIYKIPEKFKKDLAWHDKIQKLAVDLYYLKQS
jgi:ADP-ribosyl-[dinitrogen reductase] hydrolase